MIDLSGIFAKKNLYHTYFHFFLQILAHCDMTVTRLKWIIDRLLCLTSTLHFTVAFKSFSTFADEVGG